MGDDHSPHVQVPILAFARGGSHFRLERIHMHREPTYLRLLLSTHHVEATRSHHAVAVSSPPQGENASLLRRANCRRPRLCFSCRRRSEEAGFAVARLGVGLVCSMSQPSNASRVQKAARHEGLSDTHCQEARNMGPARSSCIGCGWRRLVQVDNIGQWMDTDPEPLVHSTELSGSTRKAISWPSMTVTPG